MAFSPCSCKRFLAERGASRPSSSARYRCLPTKLESGSGMRSGTRWWMRTRCGPERPQTLRNNRHSTVPCLGQFTYTGQDTRTDARGLWTQINKRRNRESGRTGLPATTASPKLRSRVRAPFPAPQKTSSNPNERSRKTGKSEKVEVVFPRFSHDFPRFFPTTGRVQISRTSKLRLRFSHGNKLRANHFFPRK
jgi:hypothetical protein